MAILARWHTILNILATREEATLSELQIILNYSPQTIRSSITLLNHQLGDIAQIITTPTGAYQLKVYDDKDFELINHGYLKRESTFNSRSKRKAYILRELFLTNDYVLIDEFAKETLVSRSTINTDLRELRQELEKYGAFIESAPNRGLKLSGDELQVRLAYFHLAQDYFEWYKVTENLQRKIKQFSQEYLLTDEQLFYILKAIDICLIRMTLKQELLCPIANFTNLVKDHPLSDLIIYLVEQEYSYTFNGMERDFIVFPLSLGLVKGVSTSQITANEQNRHIFTLMMEQIEQKYILDIDFLSFYNEIAVHLFFLTQRIIFSIESQGFFYGEIEANYPFSYQLASEALSCIASYLDREVSLVERDYLTLYFEMLIENKSSREKSIAIVCKTGRGTAGIIRNQIQKIIGKDIKIHQYSEEEYRSINFDHYIAVFTTIPVTKIQTEVPVIHVSNIFDNQYLTRRWQSIVSKTSSVHNQYHLRFLSLETQKSYEEILKELSRYLYEENLVDKDFYNNLLDRESTASTLFDNNIGFPHAIQVQTNEIALLISPVKQVIGEWKRELIIFMLGIPEKLTESNETILLSLYDDIFAVASSEDLQEELMRVRDMKEFESYMKRKGVF